MKNVLFLQTMKQRKLNILALLLLFTFLLGTVGVNVTKVYCHRCQESYLHVMVIPADVPCPCQHGCACCHACHNAHKKNCDNAKQEHTFYKVSGDWAASHFEIQFNDMEQACDVMTLFACDENSNVKSFNSSFVYIDTSPPLEVLCIFRC